MGSCTGEQVGDLQVSSSTGEQVGGRKFKYLVASGASPSDVAPVAPWRRDLQHHQLAPEGAVQLGALVAC